MVYLIRHNHDNSPLGNRSSWYNNICDTQDQAIQAIINANAERLFHHWQEVDAAMDTIRKTIAALPGFDTEASESLFEALQWFDPEDATQYTDSYFDESGREVWLEGETSFDFGDWSESVIEFDCDWREASTLLGAIGRERPTANIEQAKWLLENVVRAEVPENAE